MTLSSTKYAYESKEKYYLEDVSENINHVFEIAPPTEELKFESPQWRYGIKKIMYGFVFDWDKSEFPKVSMERFFHYKHRTHSKYGRWRIILPFEKPIEFKTAEQYKDSYRHTARVLGLEGQEGFDGSTSNMNRWFFYRPSQHPLICVDGEFIKPNVSPLAAFSHGLKVGSPRQIILGDPAHRILKKIKLLHEAGSNCANYRYIRSKKCLLHPKTEYNRMVAYNNSTVSTGSYIHSYHDTCTALLREWLAGLSKKLDNPVDVTVIEKRLAKGCREAFTIVYLTQCVCEGKLAFGAVMACYINEKLHGNLLDLDMMDLTKPRSPNQLAYLIFKGKLISKDKKYYEYNGHCHQIIDKSDLHAYISNIIQEYMYYKCQGKPSWVIQMDKFVKRMIDFTYGDTTESKCLAFSNKFLFLEDGRVEVKSPSSDHFVIDPLPYMYDSEAKCPNWMTALNDWLEPQAISVLQEYAGYCLTDDRSFEKFLFLYGTSGAGKTTIGNILIKVVKGCVTTLKKLGDDQQYPTLHRHHLAFADEAIDSGDIETLDLIKQLTSTGAVSWREIYTQSVIQSESFPKLLMTANNAEKVFNNLDAALERRTIAIEFTKKIDKQNFKLKKILLEELPGILNWAIEGYERLYRVGAFSPYNDLKNLMETVNAPVMEFRGEIMDLIEGLEGNWFPSSYLHTVYTASKPGFPMNLKTFGQKMTEAFGGGSDYKKQKNNRVCYRLRVGGNAVFDERDKVDRTSNYLEL